MAKRLRGGRMVCCAVTIDTYSQYYGGKTIIPAQKIIDDREWDYVANVVSRSSVPTKCNADDMSHFVKSGAT